MFDRDTLADLIETGRLRQAPSLDIADAILAELDDPSWAKAMSHPTRAAILREMRDNGRLSPVMASHVIEGATLATLAYHFRMLGELGLIELSETIPRRGTMEHIYRLVSTDGSE